MTSQDKIFQSKWSMCGRSLENKLQKDMLCSPSLPLSLSMSEEWENDPAIKSEK